MKDFEPASTTTARKVDVAPWRTAVPISSTALTRKKAERGIWEEWECDIWGEWECE